MRLIAMFLLPLYLTGCAGSAGYNATTFQAKIDERILDRAQFKRFVIAGTNLGKPSRTYLQGHEKKVDERIAKYLKKHGFTLVDSAVFDKAYHEGVLKYGEPFDPTTGRLNQRSFVAALHDATTSLREDGRVDAVIFTDLSESQVFFSTGINRVARFNGVTRKPSMQGAGTGVPADFDWVREVDAVSILINIYDLDLQPLFQGLGGIELTEAIDTKSSSGRFVRRRTVLGNDSHIDEGIRLAFHPLIPMKGWPGAR